MTLILLICLIFCHNSELISLSENSDGIAGVQGTVYTVNKSGEWYIRKFKTINSKVIFDKNPVKTGQLNCETLKLLKRTINKEKFLELSDIDKQTINDHFYSLSYRSKKVSVFQISRNNKVSMKTNILKNKLINAIPENKNKIRINFDHLHKFANIVGFIEERLQ